MSLFTSFFLPCLARLALGRSFTPQGLGHEIVRQDELSFAHFLDGKKHLGFFAFRRVVAADAYGFTFGTQQRTAKSLAAIKRYRGFDLDEMANIPLEIGFAHERPVNARG